MALIKCEECGNEVSDKAASCPKCGAPVAAPAPTPQRVKTSEDNALTRNRGCGDIVIFGPVLLILLIVVIYALSG